MYFYNEHLWDWRTASDSTTWLLATGRRDLAENPSAVWFRWGIKDMEISSWRLECRTNRFGEAEACQECQSWRSHFGKNTECNKAWKLSSRKLLVRDILRSLEAWPAAFYLLVPCAASPTLLIAQAAFPHAAASEESVWAPGTGQSPCLRKMLHL